MSMSWKCPALGTVTTVGRVSGRLGQGDVVLGLAHRDDVVVDAVDQALTAPGRQPGRR